MFVQLKSEWQKDDCINPNCKKESKFELVNYSDTPGYFSSIRFCGNIECLDFARKLI